MSVNTSITDSSDRKGIIKLYYHFKLGILISVTIQKAQQLKMV